MPCGCGRPTRSTTGRCSQCRGYEIGEPQPGRPTVEEQAAWLNMRERVLRDLGYEPSKVQYGLAEEVLREERVPDMPAFLKLLRGDDDGQLPVGVQDVRVGGRGGVRGVSGETHPAPGSVGPGVHPAGGCSGGGPLGPVEPGVGGGTGAETAGETTDSATATVVGVGAGLEGGEPAGAEETQVGLPVRLTRYWCGVRAGVVGVTRGSVVRGGVTLVRVSVPTRSLFGALVTVPVEYTELAS